MVYAGGQHMGEVDKILRKPGELTTFQSNEMDTGLSIWKDQWTIVDRCSYRQCLWLGDSDVRCAPRSVERDTK